MSIYNVAECVGMAFLKYMTPLNITHAFKKCGIFPFDENIFTEVDFHCTVTDRPLDRPLQEFSFDEDKTDVEDLANEEILSVDQPSTSKVEHSAPVAEYNNEECHSPSILSSIEEDNKMPAKNPTCIKTSLFQYSNTQRVTI